MRNARLTFLGLLLAILVAMPMSAATAGSPAKAACVSAGGNAKVEWTSPTATAARVYFHSSNAKQDAYVEMQRGTRGRFWAVLPKAAQGTTFVDYRIVSIDAHGKSMLRQNGRVNVIAGCQAAPLSTEERAFAASLTVGAAVDTMPVPVGFRCDGIAAYVNSKGDLVPYNACHEATRAAVSADNGNGQVTPLRTAAPGTVTATANSAAATAAPVSAPSVSALGAGVAVPYHHLRPHRAPVPVRPPQPRLQEPVSPARP